MVNTTSYQPGNSIIHRLDPRVKLVILVFLTVLVFFVKSFISVGILFFSVLFCWFLAKMSFKIILRYLRVMSFLFFLLLTMQALFYPGSTFIVRPLIPEKVPFFGGRGGITAEGILFGLLLCWRLLTMVSLLPLLLFTTTIEELVLAMVKMGLSYKIAFTATTALNQLQVLESEISQIINAQRLRGFKVFERGRLLQKLRSLPTLVVPLVIGAMRRANLMGTAMDSRAFGAEKNRTYITSLSLEAKDLVILTGSLLYIGVLIYINYRF